jgi:hypothetical protein
MAQPDLATVDLSQPVDLRPEVPECPPLGALSSDPPALGDLTGKRCDYRCWGKGTLYNLCGADRYQYCLREGWFAPCQVITP